MEAHGKLCDQCFEICTFDFCMYCDPETIKCAFCSVKFKLIKDFIDHIDTTHSEMKFKKSGPRVPRPKGLLYCEITLKENNKILNTYFCPTCKLAFQTAKTLLIHTARVHNNNNELECAYCGKKFRNKTTIRKHILCNHLKEEIFVCDICDKSFTHHINLKAHISHHMSSGNYECSLCDKSFNHPFSLKRHLKQHSSEKHYACEDCGKFFPFNFSLIRHRRIHDVREEFVCNICQKKYKWKNDLERHTKIHNNEHKSYKCETCDKVFNRKFSYVQHQQKHNSGKLHLCQCGKTYKFQSCLSRHIKTCHKVKTFEFVSVESNLPSSAI